LDHPSDGRTFGVISKTVICRIDESLLQRAAGPYIGSRVGPVPTMSGLPLTADVEASVGGRRERLTGQIRRILNCEPHYAVAREQARDANCVNSSEYVELEYVGLRSREAVTL
jgi:hypothetical protein